MPQPPSHAYLNRIDAETAERMRQLRTPDSSFTGAPEALATAVEHEVATLADELGDLTYALHAAPETAYQEHASVRALADLLHRHGVQATVGAFDMPTALRAEVGPADGPAIAILAEYDALPGLGHACGHNVIAAAGVGAFLALAAAAEREPAALPGRVVLLGTPAEEGHSGKEVLAQRGAFDDVDAAIMVHPYGYDLADQVWLGRRLLTWTFLGRAAHASAQPFMGRNALDAAALAYQGVGLLRQQLAPVDRIHATIVEGGTRPSVIPDRAVMRLYARSKYPDMLRDLSRRLDDVARGAALMTGTEVEIAWDEHPASLPVRTNQALTGRWVAAQRRRGREPLSGGVVSETIAASTDFGNVSYRVPGIHPLIKVSDADVALHTEQFAEAAGSPAAQSAAVDGAAGLALTALDYLHDADLRAAVDAEFAEAGGPIDVPRFFA